MYFVENLTSFAMLLFRYLIGALRFNHFNIEYLIFMFNNRCLNPLTWFDCDLLIYLNAFFWIL